MYEWSRGGATRVPLLRKGLSWYTDKYVKFRNPPTSNLTLEQAFEGKERMSVFLPLYFRIIYLIWDGSRLATCHVLSAFSTGTAPPPYWQKPVYELDPFDPLNNGFINDDLIVWMREAAFPNFKKLYGILHRNNKPFVNGLPAGNYSIQISYSILSLHFCPNCPFHPFAFLLSFIQTHTRTIWAGAILRLQVGYFPSSFSLNRYFWPWPPACSDFPAQYFRGRKEVVLTTLTWFGGQNHFLPIAYLVTSSLILLTAVVLTVVWWKFGKGGKNMKE